MKKIYACLMYGLAMVFNVFAQPGTSGVEKASGHTPACIIKLNPDLLLGRFGAYFEFPLSRYVSLELHPAFVDPWFLGKKPVRVEQVLYKGPMMSALLKYYLHSAEKEPLLGDYLGLNVFYKNVRFIHKEIWNGSPGSDYSFTEEKTVDHHRLGLQLAWGIQFTNRKGRFFDLSFGIGASYSRGKIILHDRHYNTYVPFSFKETQTTVKRFLPSLMLAFKFDLGL